MNTTCGSLALDDMRPYSNARLVNKVGMKQDVELCFA